MFGHKNAGLMGTVLQSPKEHATKSGRPGEGGLVNRNSQAALDAYARGEMYFAVTSTLRLIR